MPPSDRRGEAGRSFPFRGDVPGEVLTRRRPGACAWIGNGPLRSNAIAYAAATSQAYVRHFSTDAEPFLASARSETPRTIKKPGLWDELKVALAAPPASISMPISLGQVARN